MTHFSYFRVSVLTLMLRYVMQKFWIRLAAGSIVETESIPREH